MSEKEITMPATALSESELREMAAQFRKPNGDGGIAIGLLMNESNAGMIRNTLLATQPANNQWVLEIGPGNGRHLAEFHKMAEEMNYHALEISPLMLNEATAWCDEKGIGNRCWFHEYDGTNIPFEENSFDRIFTVNTLYFWEQPVLFIKELARVLKPGGRCCITYTDDTTIEKMPFTQYGFTKYSDAELEALVSQSQLQLINIDPHTETIIGKMGQQIQRGYRVAICTK